ncbi:MAG: ATP-binding cassette domain-containing protein [Planctomycetota bacterium]
MPLSSLARGSPMIHLNTVSKRYDGAATFAVRDVSLTVADGELLVLLGGSGSGKTTTLKMINRLVEPTSGRIEVEGRDVASLAPVELRRRIGYVFQGIGLFPHMTVAQNVGITPRLLGWSRGDIRGRVDELLDMVGLPPGEFARRAPHELSGGQRQRVGFARALAARPSLMLMDEPLGALDPLTRDALQDGLRQIHEQLKLTIILVTHDMTEALLLGDRIGVMNEGRLLRVDSPERLLRDPRDDYVRRLMQTPKRHADRVEALAEGRGS